MPTTLLATDKSPKLETLPADAIVTKVVLPLLGLPVDSENTPLIVFDTPLVDVLVLRSPKSDALPVLSIVTLSIELV